MSHKKCPWCGDEVDMLIHPAEDVMNTHNTVWRSEHLFIPICKGNSCIEGLYVIIDAESEEEAWEKWDQLNS